MLGSKPGLLVLMVWALSVAQQGFEERSRTISLAVVALGVLICGLRFFKDALIPLVLAIALKHLLQPVINVLTNRPLRCCGRSLLAEPMACVGVPRRNRRLQTLLAYACRLQLSRTAAAIVSLLLAFAVLGAILAIVADSVHVLVDNAEEYAKQLKVIVGNPNPNPNPNRLTLSLALILTLGLALALNLAIALTPTRSSLVISSAGWRTFLASGRAADAHCQATRRMRPLQARRAAGAPTLHLLTRRGI